MDDAPHLITHVETTPGPVADGDATPRIHEALRAKDLLPGQHLTDTGYLDTELLVDSQQEYGVDLVGPTRPNYRWQARAGDGFAASDFQVDWEAQRVTCPEGRRSIGWTEAVGRGPQRCDQGQVLHARLPDAPQSGEMHAGGNGGR